MPHNKDKLHPFHLRELPEDTYNQAKIAAAIRKLSVQKYMILALSEHASETINVYRSANDSELSSEESEAL